ncbi:MAG: UMP kinase [Candidatus Woesearchaeota archaeon]|jgi:uridylate kinase|nr:UMP kinase [Candidatus Woesearchaeota archaeon]|tara:strand:+ start:49 stop:720 length:672 start_codon:yes stop_codon:yes gene_type:complete
MKTIISLGGSLIIPEEIDHTFLKQFKELINKQIKKGNSFVIYCGGGSLARRYQDSAKKITSLDNEELDWLGINATILNANLIKTIFKSNAEENIVIDPTKKISPKKPVLVAAGWKPGWSTDYDAVLLAKNLNIRSVINMTNVDYVYDKNPKEHKDAKPIKQTTWGEFRKLVGDEWTAGLNMPFDPIAAKESEKLNLNVTIIGKDIDNLEKVLENKEFKGTKIR